MVRSSGARGDKREGTVRACGEGDEAAPEVPGLTMEPIFVRTSCGCTPALSREVLPAWLHLIIHEEGRLTLTDTEAGRLLGISRGSVRAAIGENEICSVRLGRRLLIPLIPLLTMMGLEPSSEGSDR
ncbi:MAG: hypothetical protein ACYCX3_01600 [Thermoleophilia bacterium]